jgi:hypothetical protein
MFAGHAGVDGLQATSIPSKIPHKTHVDFIALNREIVDLPNDQVRPPPNAKSPESSGLFHHAI